MYFSARVICYTIRQVHDCFISLLRNLLIEKCYLGAISETQKI